MIIIRSDSLLSTSKNSGVSRELYKMWQHAMEEIEIKKKKGM